MISSTCAWTKTKLPDELELAQVVTLYKKGNVEDPSNYRPISLLQSLYKIYVSVIRNRMIEGIDERILSNQYGFRAKKSTAQPLFIARRLIDIAEASGDKLILVFLDSKPRCCFLEMKISSCLSVCDLVANVWESTLPWTHVTIMLS